MMFRVVCILLIVALVNAFSIISNRNHVSSLYMKDVLLIGGTRFSGLYLWRQLHKDGHKVTIFNRGKTSIKKIPVETDAEFEKRKADAIYVKGDRTKPEDLNQLSSMKFDVIYDMNGREATDTAPLADMFNGKVEHFVYMSSAGVYKKSLTMPHIEGDNEDVKSRHKGKLETEAYLKKIGIPFTSIRPTYIYGPMNYNPIEEYFFERIAEGRPVCIPGHGQHLTGLGHVEDLASAMAKVIGKKAAIGQIYNVQDIQSVTFEGLAKLCGEAMGKETEIKLYKAKDFDFGEKKAFPMREQHFFCSVEKAMKDLDWKPKYNMIDGLKDSYVKDFQVKQKDGKLKKDFECDDKVIKDDRISVIMGKV